VGVDWRLGGFSIEPELIMAAQQQQTFTGETRTPGYAIVNLKASYTMASQHIGHQFSFDLFNAGDALYRNHTSFIKDLAPEIGRGVKFSYMMRFF
jgi:iron complex outermembrane receptor protein